MLTMGIVLFAVCTVFGVTAVVLWALLSSVRLKLAQSKQLAATMLQIIEDREVLDDAERASLVARFAAIYSDP